MRLSIRSQADFVAGAILAAIGAGALLVARGYPLGTLARVGPGLFPTAAATLLIGLAAVLLIGSVTWQGESRVSLAPLPILIVVGSGLLFALMLRPLGVLPASAATVLVSTLASRTLGWLPALLLAIFVAAFVALVFVAGLGLQAPLVGPWLLWSR